MEFYEYFKLAFPVAYEWRWYRTTLYWALMKGSLTSGFAYMGKSVLKFFKKYGHDHQFSEEELNKLLDN